SALSLKLGNRLSPCWGHEEAKAIESPAPTRARQPVTWCGLLAKQPAEAGLKQSVTGTQLQPEPDRSTPVGHRPAWLVLLFDDDDDMALLMPGLDVAVRLGDLPKR